jgi:hypothetical protein
MKFLKGITAIVYPACTLVLTFYVCGFVAAAKKTVAHIDTVAQDAGSAVKEVHDAVALVKDTAQEDKKYYTAAAKEIPETGKAIRALADYTNKSLNEPHAGAIPVFSHAMTLAALDVDSFTNHGTQSLDTLTAAGQVSIEAWGHAADEISSRMNDVRFDDIITNLDHTSEHLELTALHFDNISAMGEQEVRRLTKPASFAKQVGMGALDVGAKMGSIFAGFVK